MDKELYEKLLNSLPERYKEDVKHEIEFNHMDLEPMTVDDFLITCKWVLYGKKLHLRRVISNASLEFIEKRNEEIRELENYIRNFDINEIAK